MSDTLIRATSDDGRLRAMVAVTTQACETIRERQQTDPTATVALARLISGTALMGALLKGQQRLGLMIEGNGPLERLMAETDAQGQLRASVRQPITGLPPKNGEFDVVGAIGRAGFLTVTKDLGLKEPYKSRVQLQTSEIGDDLAWYLTSSEQVPSSVALGVQLTAEAKVASAGGFIVQSLPPADEGAIHSLEKRLASYGSVSQRIREGETPHALLADLFSDIPHKVIAETALTFSCHCSLSHSLQLLRSLGRNELCALFREQPTVTVTCEYCRQSYHIDQEQGQKLIDQLARH